MTLKLKANVKWEEAVATNILLVDFHLHHVKEILKVEEVRKDLKKDQWKEGAAPIHIAAALGRTEVMQLLIDEGANVNW